MKQLFTLIALLALALPASGQTIKRQFGTTNDPTTLTNIILGIAGQVGGATNGIEKLNGFGTNTTLRNLTIIGNGIVLVSGDTQTPYAPTADNDSARGIAMHAAILAATAGDLIVVGPGDYLATNSIVKNGVDWEFSPGARVYGSRVIDDYAGAAVFQIGGYGEFDSTNDFASIHLTNSASSAVIVGNAFRSLKVGTVAAVQILDSDLRLTVFDRISSAGYDGLWLEGSGTVYCEATTIEADENSLEIYDGQLWVQAAHLISTTDSAINVSGGTNFINALTVQTLSPSTLEAINVNGGDTTLQTPRIRGRVQMSDGQLRIIDALIGDVSSDILPPIYITGPATTFTILENCTLDASHASLTNSIFSIDPITVQIVGALNYNKPIHANVTLDTDGFTQSYFGNGGGLSNAVNIIAGSNVTVTTNANGRAFTIASTGGSVSLIPGSNVTITTNTPGSVYTIASTGGGSGDTNGMTYVLSGGEWLPAIRVRLAPVTSSPVAEWLFTNNVPFIAVTNGGDGGFNGWVINEDTGGYVLKSDGLGGTHISASTAVGIGVGAVPVALWNGSSFRINDLTGATAIDHTARLAPIFGDTTLRTDLIADGDFLVQVGTSIVGTQSVSLATLNVTTANLGSIGVTNNMGVTNNLIVHGVMTGNGQGITNISLSSIRAGTNWVTTTPDYSKPWGLLTTNNNFAWLTPINFNVGETNVDQCVRLITNSAASLIDFTAPAGYTFTGTLNVTQGGVTMVTFTRHPSVISNLMSVPLK